MLQGKWIIKSCFKKYLSFLGFAWKIPLSFIVHFSFYKFLWLLLWIFSPSQIQLDSVLYYFFKDLFLFEVAFTKFQSKLLCKPYSIGDLDAIHSSLSRIFELQILNFLFLFMCNYLFFMLQGSKIFEKDQSKNGAGEGRKIGFSTQVQKPSV